MLSSSFDTEEPRINGTDIISRRRLLLLLLLLRLTDDHCKACVDDAYPAFRRFVPPQRRGVVLKKEVGDA